MISRDELLADQPPPLTLTAGEVRAARGDDAAQLIVLDDDPTGTQSVAQLPVLTAWSVDDLVWALRTDADAVYVMTNSRSLDAVDAERRTREVVRAGLAAAERAERRVEFVSRSDSTLRGHYPLETDAICDELAASGIITDGVLIVPGFGDAGRITVDSVHYAGSGSSGYTPVGETEFADDATFGYRSSQLCDWVEEKTGGAIPAEQVARITLAELRTGEHSARMTLHAAANRRVIVADQVDETDLRALVLLILSARADGKRFVYRVGPPFVRAMIGQEVQLPLDGDDVAAITRPGVSRGGLVVVGSHVELTTRQLDELRRRDGPAEFEIDVQQVLGDDRESHLDELVRQASEALADSTVVLRTTRTLVRGEDKDDSLRIAREVSDAVVQVVRQLVDLAPPRFVIAKGGITSSDVASRGLGINRAMVRGSMLPGLVSLWEPIEGPAQGIGYIVFAGNVGDENSLADVVQKLSDGKGDGHRNSSFDEGAAQ